MTRRLFVCHASADIEATSEIVDALENALSFPEAALWTSGLPGYSADPNDMPALGSALVGSNVVMALITQASVGDPQFNFQLGAAWAADAHIVLFVLDRQAQAQLPHVLSQAAAVFGQGPEQWCELIGDLSLRLGLAPRPAASTAPSIAPSLHVQDMVQDMQNVHDAATDPRVTPSTTTNVARADAPADTRRSYFDELRAIGESTSEPTRKPPKQSYIDELRALEQTEQTPEPGAAPCDEHASIEQRDESAEFSQAQELEEEPATGEQLRVPPAAEQDAELAGQAIDSDVFARLPTCEMALEAGRAVSDCVFNRAEIDDFAAELNEPLGRLIESLGADWDELRCEQDFDTWVAVTDQLLKTLPNEVRKLEEWYRVGFELATLHNLAGQLVLDGSDATAEQHWRGALERFLMRAERAEIRYEDLGRVLGLLENLAGPSNERDLANIPRSLEELRRYAAGADIHTAA